MALALVQICIDALSRRTDLLEAGVGFLDPKSVRQILAGISDAARLATIEDATRASCGHDLTWYTWQLWHRLYTRDYGPIPPGAALPPLPKPPPTDYAPPPYNAGPANYRRLYEAKGSAVSAAREQAAAALRARYQAAAAETQKKRVQVTDKLPPPKRARKAGSSLASASSTGSSSSSKSGSRDKVLRQLLGRPGSTGAAAIKKPPPPLRPLVAVSTAPGSGGARPLPGQLLVVHSLTAPRVSASGAGPKLVIGRAAPSPTGVPAAAAAAAAAGRGSSHGRVASGLVPGKPATATAASPPPLGLNTPSRRPVLTVGRQPHNTSSSTPGGLSSSSKSSSTKQVLLGGMLHKR